MAELLCSSVLLTGLAWQHLTRVAPPGGLGAGLGGVVRGSGQQQAGVLLACRAFGDGWTHACEHPGHGHELHLGVDIFHARGAPGEAAQLEFSGLATGLA